MKAADLFRRKAWDEPAPGDGAPALRRTLGALDLTLLGVGAIVGAGIFSSVGPMAAGGPDHPAASGENPGEEPAPF